MDKDSFIYSHKILIISLLFFGILLFLWWLTGDWHYMQLLDRERVPGLIIICLLTAIFFLLAVQSARLSLAVKQRTEQLENEADERKKNEYLLSESQQIAHIGSWSCDIATKRITWTKETYRIHGVSPDTFDLSLESFINLIHPDDRGVMQEWVRACLAGEKPDEVEFRIVLSSGDVRTLRGRGNLIYDSENNPVRMIGTVQDITEGKKAEKLLINSETKYRDLFESAIDAIFILDLQGNFIDVNRVAYTRLGYSKEEMISMHITRLDPPEFAAKVPERLAQIREHGFAVFESAHVKKDGTVMPVEVNSRLYDYDGRKVYFSVIRDISERKKVAEKLQEALRFNQQIIASAQEGILAYDTEYKFTLWNPRMETTTGIKAEDVIGKHSLEVFPFLKEQGVYALHERAMSGEIVSTPDYPFYVPSTGKSGWAQSDYVPLTDAKGNIIGILGTVRNITERKKIEAQLLQAQKMESIGVLAGGIAHDFNNALTAIIGFAHILRMRSKENEQLSQYIEQILTVSNMAAKTVRSLLAFSRKQIIAPRPVDLNHLVVGMKQLMKNILGEDIELTANICSHSLTVMADSAQIEQALINLVANARDAMPHGGKLTIETDRSYLDDEEAKAYSFKKPGYFGKLLVSDTGCGIDQKTMETIYDPFSQQRRWAKAPALVLQWFTE